MDKKPKETEEVCDSLGYKYKFLRGRDCLIVYGKSKSGTSEQYISGWLITYLASEYYVLWASYKNNKLEMTFKKINEKGDKNGGKRSGKN